MESSGTKGRTPPIQQTPQTRPATQAPPRSALPERAITPDTDLLTAAKTTVQWAETEKVPYWKLAFKNPYNLSLLAGGLAVSVLGGGPLLALATLGLEGLWMLHAPESSFLRRALWDPQLQKRRQEIEDRARSARLAYLSPEARQRVLELVDGQREIRRLAAQNPSFAGAMLREELDKTDRLVTAFIDLSVTCARYEDYLGSVDEPRLAKEKQRLEQICGISSKPAPAGRSAAPPAPPAPEAPDDDQPAGLARKNLA